MFKKFLFIVLTVVIITGLFLGSCAKSTPAPATSTTPAPVATLTTSAPTPDPDAAKYGGRLRLIGGANVGNIGNPDEISNPGDSAYSFVCTEGLLRSDAKGNLEPWLAEKYEIAKDGSSVTFYLRKGINFTDGTPFNAAAVKVNVDIQLKTISWANMRSVENCQVIDDSTVKLNFKDGKFDWVVLNSLAGFFSCMMFSPTYLQNNTAEYKRSNVVGTGPFKLVEFARDQYIKYDRNDDYWGGKPYLDGIDYAIIPDPTSALLAFKSGAVDMIGIQTKDAADMIKSGFDVRESATFVFNMSLLPNSVDPESPWNDIRVRQAFEYAIDKETLIKGLTYGYGHISNQTFLDTQAYYNPDVVGYPYDLAKAKALMVEAGFPDGFTAKVLCVDSMPLDVILAVQDMVKEIGINLETDRVSLPKFSTQVAAGEGSGWSGLVVGGTFAGAAGDPANSLMNGPLSNRTTWVSNDQPDEAYALSKQAASELDPQKRVQLYRDLMKMLTDKYAQMCWLYWTPNLYSLAAMVQGVDFNHSSYAYAHAWLEKK